jgi:hypothetical protein
VHDRDADVALEDPTVGNNEALPRLARDAQLLENRCRHPRELTTGIHEDIVDRALHTAQTRMLDSDADAEGAHC